jgi:hypothetical protein
MGRIYKRGETYRGDWRETSGRRHRQSLATRDKAVARERLRELELAPPDRASNRKTLGAAVSYLIDVVYAGRPKGTVSCYQQKARHLVRILGTERPVGTIDRESVQRYRAARLAEKTAESTVCKELIVLRLTLAEQGIEGVVPSCWRSTSRASDTSARSSSVPCWGA